MLKVHYIVHFSSMLIFCHFEDSTNKQFHASSDQHPLLVLKRIVEKKSPQV